MIHSLFPAYLPLLLRVVVAAFSSSTRRSSTEILWARGTLMHASPYANTMADINKEVAFAFASNFSSFCFAYAMRLFMCVLAKARKIASKSKCYLFINMSHYLCIHYSKIHIPFTQNFSLNHRINT
jgi:hypothetical protein